MVRTRAKIILYISCMSKKNIILHHPNGIKTHSFTTCNFSWASRLVSSFTKLFRNGMFTHLHNKQKLRGWNFVGQVTTCPLGNKSKNHHPKELDSANIPETPGNNFGINVHLWTFQKLQANIFYRSFMAIQIIWLWLHNPRPMAKNGPILLGSHHCWKVGYQETLGPYYSIFGIAKIIPIKT